MKVRQKPLVVEAVRWRGYNSNLGVTAEPAAMPVKITEENMHLIRWEPIPDWMPKPLLECIRGPNGSRCPAQPGEIRRDGELLMFGTEAGEQCAFPGDWIIKHPDGRVLPCPADEFAARFEDVEPGGKDE